MTRFTLLLVFSLALNVGLVTLFILQAASTARPPGLEQNALVADGSISVTESQSVLTSPFPAIVRDYRRLYTALHGSGMPDTEIHRVLRGVALADWRDDVVRLHREVKALDDTMTASLDPFQEITDEDLEFQRVIIELRREREVALASLIGESVLIDPRQTLFAQINLPNLPPEKRREVVMLEEDYRLLMMEIQMNPDPENPGPGDREASRLLKEERHDDLSRILSPEELAEYELRFSQTANTLRQELRLFNATEEEFRHIFQMRQELDSEFPPEFLRDDPVLRDQRHEAEEQMKAQLREILGADRFAAFRRSQDPEYQLLIELSNQLHLPRERADAVYEIKELAAEQRMMVHLDGELSPEEQRDVLQLLADEAQQIIRDALGDRGFEQYMETNGWWLRQLELEAESDLAVE